VLAARPTIPTHFGPTLNDALSSATNGLKITDFNPSYALASLFSTFIRSSDNSSAKTKELKQRNVTRRINRAFIMGQSPVVFIDYYANYSTILTSNRAHLTQLAGA
jgi:hypothetical protein